MNKGGYPKNYSNIRQRHGDVIKILEKLGTRLREEGPLDLKTGHLIQLAGAVALRSEGAVHSHARRALAAGAAPEEIRQAILLLTCTAGFPAVAAALSWVENMLDGGQ